MVRFTIWQLFESDPDRGQALDCTSDRMISADNAGLTVYYKQYITHQSPDKRNRNHGDHEEGEKESRGIRLTSFGKA